MVKLNGKIKDKYLLYMCDKLLYLDFDKILINKMRILFIVIFLICSSMIANAYAQKSTYTISIEDNSLRNALWKLDKITDLKFFYKVDDVKNVIIPHNKFKDKNLENILTSLLYNTNLEYEIIHNSVVIRKKSNKQQNKKITISGVIKNIKGELMAGVNVVEKGTLNGTASDNKGHYSINVANNNTTLIFSFIGMRTKQIKLNGNNIQDVILEDDAASINEVVITGIYTRNKESFTGSATTYTGKDLKTVGGTNIIQSLKSLDPSFGVIEDNQFGSDPNRLPDIEIRGKSSLLGIRDNLVTDPNRPLFILDGFEVSLQTIFNLDMNRVESITLLKDAASTAIYGSKAANGVVVVETLKPKAGELRVSYYGRLNLSTPDLSSYNMMNASEKLEFERLAGQYDGTYVDKDIVLKERYYKLKQNIDKGVDTYWLAEPLRLGIDHRHSIYINGGGENFMFTAGGSYNDIMGVMKQSKRRNISANIDIAYRINKFQFTNKFSVDNTTSNNPNVTFNEFVKANPYYPKYNPDGFVDKWLEYTYVPNIINVRSGNPMYNNNLNSFNRSDITTYSNKFIAEYRPLPELKIKGRFSISKLISKQTRFKSPSHTDYDKVDLLYRGSYLKDIKEQDRYEGELSFTYGKTFTGGHQLNVVTGANIYSETSILEGYSVIGFPIGDFSFPSFSKGYPDGGNPKYINTEIRSISAFANFGYSYNNKYLMDFSYRINGSSIFGSSKRYANTWSLGLGWNIANEEFIKYNTDFINMLKLRASIGNPGNQNFDSFMTITSYRYTFNSFNYFGINSVINTVGNPNLRWQTTQDKNIGIDITIFNNRFNLNFDYFHKVTDPLLISVNVPSSTGVTVENTNLGNQTTKGINISAMYYIIHRLDDRFTWNVRANLRHYTSKLGNIGTALEALNKYGQTNKTLSRYYDGADPDNLWAVKSLGIDPASGRELLLKKDNSRTYDYDINDEVIVGNMRHKVEGVIGSGFYYKGLSVDVTFRYRIGGDIFNNALFTKVEGISSDSYNYNLDKRAFYDRWQKAGDYARYKNIADAATSKITSRFVSKSNSLSIESLRLGYELPIKWLSRFNISQMKIDIYANDIAYFSSVKAERGFYYPFARSYQLALSVNF